MTSKRTVMAAGLCFASLFWVVDAGLDYLFFHGGSFLDRLLFDVSPHDWFVRATVLVLSVAFSAVMSAILTRQRLAEERTDHLNAVLRAIRNVEQLIVTEKDRAKLLEGVGERLIETRGYAAAWAALLHEDGTFETVFEAGLGADFAPVREMLQRGDMTECMQAALAERGVVTYENQAEMCIDCPLHELYAGRAGMAVRLDHGGRVYGTLTVSLPAELTDDAEEQALIQEVADDIALALHAIEAEEARTQAEEALAHRTADLGERIKELACLYAVSELTQAAERPLPEVLQGVTDAIVESWQYPEITCARVTLEGHEAATANFAETPWMQTSDIDVDGARIGTLEVGYLEEMAASFEGPFLREERLLIDGVAERLRAFAERRRLSETRDVALAELETRNAALTTFAYTVSHDLKAPLVTIAGFAGMLEQEIKDGDAERVTADIARIVSAAGTMRRLLDDVLELSQIGRVAGSIEEVPLAELARQAAELNAHAISERGIEVCISPELPVVRGERPRLLQVMMNLVDNAVQFMGDQPEPRIEMGVRWDDDERVCYVRDSGIGIAAEHCEGVFGLFNKLDKSAEGTGLGLALSRRVVETHGGRMWVESAGPGAGSTFCFTIGQTNSTDCAARSEEV